MVDFFIFSNYIKPIGRRIQFFLIVCSRFFVILFRWRKGIKLLDLDYAKKHQFENSYLVIRYKFRNVLWYNFKNISKTTEKEIIVLNLKNVSEEPITLIVYGFFRSKAFHISVIPEKTFQNNSFKTVIETANKIELREKSILLRGAKPTIKASKTKLNHTEIQIKQLSYNQTDFI